MNWLRTSVAWWSLSALSVVLSVPGQASAQAGDSADAAGVVQAPLPSDLRVPAAPVLSPREALAAFTVADGLRVELVAAEPLLDDPVVAVFDDAGRLWVVEMLGYMPDVDGAGESRPVGSIAILEDTDGDGRMDARTTFLDGLVLPRGVLPLADGSALVLAPPELLHCRDTDGDGRSDEQRVVAGGLGGIESPEHAANGLLACLDNSVALANHGRRYRRRYGRTDYWRLDDGRTDDGRTDSGWTSEPVTSGGQWGLCQDDLGRLFFNTNSDGLRGHLVSPHYGRRNPGAVGLAGLNRRVADDQRVWPVRMTPGVNRGYQAATLDAAFKLTRFTAVCGPLVHRGDALPAGWRGAAFVCEPAANLVKRYVLADDAAGRPVGRPAWEGREVLASTDERFRPVNLVDGPDGALYVVDMYRGILQHRIFVTTFLRRQILERGLDQPVGLGRIWRLVGRDAERPSEPLPSELSLLPLVESLSHGNGWRRDRAQERLLALGAGPELVAAVRGHAAGASSPWGRIHALWTLDGLGALRRDDVTRGLCDADSRVVTQAVRLAEPWLATGRTDIVDRLLALAHGAPATLRRQVLFSLGEGPRENALSALVELLVAQSSLAEDRDAVLSGLAEREGAFLGLLLADDGFSQPGPGRGEMLRELAGLVVRGKASVPLEELLAGCVGAPAWQVRALVGGVLAARGMDVLGQPARIQLVREPVALRALREAPGDVLGDGQGDDEAAALLDDLAAALWWPGHPEALREVVVRPLDEASQAAFLVGRELFTRACATCHQPSGRGEPGKAPPLRHSPWVLGPPERLVPILLHGLSGPIVVDGVEWNLPMPALPVDDEALSALLTYVRREWGHGADPLNPAEVAAIRARHPDRDEPWTVAELEAALDREAPIDASGTRAR